MNTSTPAKADSVPESPLSSVAPEPPFDRSIFTFTQTPDAMPTPSIQAASPAHAAPFGHETLRTWRSLKLLRTILLSGMLFFGHLAHSQIPPGPGFPNVTRDAFGGISETKTDATDNRARTVGLDFINGYLTMDSREVSTNGSPESMQVWDISTPEAPVEIKNARTAVQSSMHTATVLLPHHRITGRGSNSMNVQNPLSLRKEAPPGFSPIDNGTRGLSLLPYQYTGGNTVEISDARTGNKLSTIRHGFEGAATPFGNLLIIAGIRDQARGFATYDISDPANPVLLDLIGPNDPVWEDRNPSYEYFFWKHYLVLPNVQGVQDCAFVDFSNPRDLRHVLHMQSTGSYSELPGRPRYAQFQDNKMFLGSGIYDMTPLDSGLPPTLLRVDDHNGEYMLPLGNLFVSAENSDQGSITGLAGSPYRMKILTHQLEPDTSRPTVVYHNPSPGAVNQHVKSRIAVMIHETLDYATITSSTFRVFPLSGGPDVTGTLNWHDKDILTFTPHTDLAPGTTYRVLVVDRGIKDVSGNGIMEKSFDFTTAGGSAPAVVLADPICEPYPVAVGGTATLSVGATGGVGQLQYSWSFGDGSQPTAYSASAATINHLYASRGHYTVQVNVRDSGSPIQTASKSLVVTVAPTATAPPSTKGSQIVLNGAARRIWCVNSDNNTVSAIDADTLVKVAEFTVGRDPRSIALDGSGNLWVTCLDDDRLEVRSTTGALVKSLNFAHGARPHDVVFNSSKSYAYVTLMGSGKVVRINPTLAPLQIDVELDSGPSATAIAIDSSRDRLMVNRFISPDSSGEVRQFSQAGGSIASGQMINLALDTTSAETGQSGRGLPNYLADVAIDPFHEFAYVAAKQDNILRGGFRNGEALSHDSTVRAIVSKISLATNSQVARFDIDNSSQPSALAFSTHGDYLFIALQGNNHLRVMDTFTGGLVATLDTGKAPQGLCFDPSTSRLFVSNMIDRTVSVFNLAAGLRSGAFPQAAHATVRTVANEIMPVQVLAGKRIFYDASDPRMGSEGYLNCAVCHQDGDHDGRVWDFTNRGEGLRNTTNLRGRSGSGHGNVHWSANFDEIQDFELDIVNAFGGTGFLMQQGGANPPLGIPNGGRSADLDALAAYVTSLGAESIEKSPYRRADGRLTVAAAKGKKLFEGTVVPQAGTAALGCITCHNPATGFTNSTISNNAGGALDLRNVGTLKASSGQRLGASLTGIDTPTLLGLHASAPYLHDGSAATVDAVFTQFVNGAPLGTDGAAHNLSASGYNLSPAETNQLMAYILQIDGSPDGDVTAPGAPSSLVAIGGSGSVSLNWADNGESDLASYTIYRSTTSQSYGPPLATGRTLSEFLDTTVASGVTYYYTVTAVDSNDNESLPSLQVFATPTMGNLPPAFTQDPILAGNVAQGIAYTGSIAGYAADPESDAMTFSKVSGPAWLSVLSNGAFGGTPGAANVGTNTFTVQVGALGGFDTAILSITVNPIVTYTAGANGTVSISGPQTIVYNGTSIVTAIPNPGYHFVRWSDGSTVNPRTDANVIANLDITAIYESDLPLGWQTADIGGPTISGDVTASGGVFTVRGSGSGILGTSDQFRFVYQSMSGDGSITARITGHTNATAASIAGVMIRESNDPASKFAAAGHRGSANSNMRAIRRTAVGGVPSNAGNPSLQPGPGCWVRVTRRASDNSLEMSSSPNGTTWTNIATTKVTMGTNVLVGIAVTSGSNSVLDTDLFDSVTVVP